jgi:hypothetical protein
MIMRLEWYVVKEISGRWVRSPMALSKTEADNIAAIGNNSGINCKSVHRSDLEEYLLSA